MKPITIAKNVWKHAQDLQDQIDKGLLKRPNVLYHYFGLLSMYGAQQAAICAKDEEWLAEIIDMLGKYPDEFETSRHFFNYNFCNYRVGGLAKAWLCMKGYFDEEQLEFVREYAEKTMTSPMSHDGILCGPKRLPLETIWIDIVYAVVPYMLFAGIALKEEKYIDFAVDQCFKLYDVFLDKETGLVRQGRGFMIDKMEISHDHWSRGNGWGYIGLAELVRYLPKDSKHYKEAVERFVAHSKALIKYQDHRGLWRQIISEPLAWEESSGSALILYGFGIGIRLGLLDKEEFMPAFEKGIYGLMKHCVKEDFSVDKCCMGCLCPGDTPERKGTLEAYLVDVQPALDDGHAFGPIILAMTEAQKNGLKNIDWRQPY